MIQVFKPECPELTVDKLHHEYAYLRAIYAAMPMLIPRQRLVTPRSDASLQDSLLVKDYIPHRLELAMTRRSQAAGLQRCHQNRSAQVRRGSASRS